MLATRVARATPFYYGWVVVATSAAANTSRVVGAVEISAVFVAALIADYGWSSTLLAAAVFIGSSGSAIGGPIVGRVLDRHGPRLVTPLGTTVVAVSCFALAATNSILMYIVFYSLVRMAGQGLVQFSSQITTAKWFERRRGRAIALLSLISSAGLAAAPPIAQAVINAHGISAAWALFGFVALGLGTVPSLLLLVRRPEDMGLCPDGGASALPATPLLVSAAHVGFTARDALRTPALWFIVPAVFAISAVMTGYGFHQLAYYVERGISSSTGAVVVSVFALGFSFGGVIWGSLADRFSVHGLLTILYASGGCLLLLLLGVHSSFEAFLCAFGFGFLVGGSIQLPTLLLASYFGRTHLGAIGGMVHMARGFGLGSGPLIGGLIIDATGYPLAWLVFAAMAAGAAVMMGFAKRPRAGSWSGGN